MALGRRRVLHLVGSRLGRCGLLWIVLNQRHRHLTNTRRRNGANDVVYPWPPCVEQVGGGEIWVVRTPKPLQPLVPSPKKLSMQAAESGTKPIHGLWHLKFFRLSKTLKLNLNAADISLPPLTRFSLLSQPGLMPTLF